MSEKWTLPEHLRRTVVDAVHKAVKVYDFGRNSTRWAVTYDAANAALSALGLEQVGYWCQVYGFTHEPHGDSDCHATHSPLYRLAASGRTEGEQ